MNWANLIAGVLGIGVLLVVLALVAVLAVWLYRHFHE
jgi:hypothetical protein